MNPLHEHLRNRLLDAIEALGVARSDAESMLRLDPPKNRDHGDVAFGAFQLAKSLKQAPPAIAASLAEKVPADDVVASSTAAGPFVNFKFQRSALAAYVLTSICENSAPYGPATIRQECAATAAVATTSSTADSSQQLFIMILILN